MPHLYTTKNVASIIGIKPQTVKNYSDVEDYNIRPIQVGSGRGSRKLYSDADIYLIGIAEKLAECGFTVRAIGNALRALKAFKFDWFRGCLYILVNRAGNWAVLEVANFAPEDNTFVLQLLEPIYGYIVLKD